MFEFNQSVFINLPQAEVFAFVTDLENDPKWQKTIESVEKVSGESNGLGSVWRYELKFLGRKLESEIKVTGFDPPSQASVKSIGGPVPFENTYTFKPKDGGTQLSIKGHADIGGFFKLAEGLVGGQMEKQMEADLNALKKLLESEKVSNS